MTYTESVMPITRAAIVVSLLLMIGCSGGSYARGTGFHITLPHARQTRAVVWGDHKGAVGRAITWLQQRGLSLVERARLQQVLQEQKIQLTRTPDDDIQALRVGRLIGAQLIVFVDVTITQSEVQHWFFNPFYGWGSGQTFPTYELNVSVRGIDVETSEVLWSGNAFYPAPVTSPTGVLPLTDSALERAWCPADSYEDQTYPWGEEVCHSNEN